MSSPPAQLGLKPQEQKGSRNRWPIADIARTHLTAILCAHLDATRYDSWPSIGGETMRRREFITLLGVAAMAWPLVAHAQEPKKIPHLCFLTFDPGTLQSSPRFDVFFNSLRDLGYVDGQTIVIDYLSADGKDDRFPALASECLRLKADLSP